MDLFQIGKRRALSFFLLFFASQLYAQLPQFQRYDISDGLASDRVYDILQDAKGYMWFATEAGLSKFDGYSFTQTTTDEGLPVNEVLKLMEDSQGRMWCMTFPGIPTYMEGKNIVHSRNAPWLQKAEVPIYFPGFTEDSEGAIWLVGLNSWVFRLDLEKRRIESFSPAQLEGTPRNVWQDQQGRIWLIGRVKTWQWLGTAFAPPKAIPHYQSHNSFPTRNGEMLGVGWSRVFKYENGKQIVLFEDPDLSDLSTNHIMKDNRGDIWLSTSSGIFRYKEINGQWKRSSHLIPGQFISRFFQDREGNYWASTLGQGVLFFSSFDIPCIQAEDLQNLPYFCLEVDQEGELLVGGYKSWGRVRGKKLVLSSLPDMENNHGRISQILSSPAGPTFLLYPGGLIRVAENGKLSHHDITAKNILKGPKESVFLTGNRHIFQFQANEWLPENLMRDTSFHNAHQVFQGRVFDIAYSPKHGYIAVANDSLFLFNGETFVPFQKELPMTAQFLRKLHSDLKGELWLLLEGQGVAHLQNGKWHIIGPEDGLSSTLMFSISDGPNQSILVGTQKGLCIIQAKGPGKHSIRVLDKFDGLPSNVIYDAIFHKDSIWVATPAGLAGFNPQSLKAQPYDPPIHFTHFGANQQEQPLDSNLVLHHHQNNIAIGFKGLSFRHEGQLIYRYRMVNQDTAWSKTSFPQVDFPQLLPGNYQFEVQPLRRDGQPSQHSIDLIFSIQPPFWATLWFKTLCFSILALALFLFFRIRVFSYNRDVVQEILELLLKKFRPRAYLQIKTKGASLRIPQEDILHLETMGDYVKLVTVQRSYVVHNTLKSMAQELPPSDFIRIHRSFMVRKEKVTGIIGKKAVLVGEKELPIGRTYKTQVLEALSKLLLT